MKIEFEDFQKIEIKIGKVKSVEKVENTDKLLKFIFDLGTEERQILSGIAEFIENPENLIGKEMPILTNLKPRKFKGIESQGMILMADDNDKPIFIFPEKDVTPGSNVR